MSERPVHATHPAILARLRRAGGHLASVIEMIEAGRPCAETAQQLHAVEKAVGAAKRTLIHDHIDNCLDGGAADIAELRAIARHL